MTAESKTPRTDAVTILESVTYTNSNGQRCTTQEVVAAANVRILELDLRAAQESIARLTVDAEGGPWISVEERLPAEGEWVLCSIAHTRGGGWYTACGAIRGKFADLPRWVCPGYNDNFGCVNGTVTDWMPIPRPKTTLDADVDAAIDAAREPK